MRYIYFVVFAPALLAALILGFGYLAGACSGGSTPPLQLRPSSPISSSRLSAESRL